MGLIRYVGAKLSKTDNVAKTGIVWLGHGDVQEVPDAALPLLLRHPDVWELATDYPEPPAPPVEDPPERQRFVHVSDHEDSVYVLRDLESGELISLAGMSDTELKNFARVNGIKTDLRKRDDELRAGIVATVIEATPKE